MTLLYRIEKSCAFLGYRFLRIARFLVYFRDGMKYEYPICCVSQFAWVSSHRHRRRKYPLGNAQMRGSIFAGIRPDGTKKIYVPCSYHKGRHPQWTAYGTKPRGQLRLFPDEVGRT